jgi:Na+/H+ antiporter NhaD/arsenite permease-like protein
LGLALGWPEGNVARMSAVPELAVPVWMACPFALLLAGIAIGPAFFHGWWDRMYPRVSALLAIVTVGLYLPGRSVAPFLHAVQEYVGFVVLVGSLFVASGGILIRVRGESTPIANVLFLAVGAILANLIGTTGASMVLIRPWIRTNRYRMTGFHVVFFILLVSNIGGCLTPIGDPPLFLGYLKGVPFWWVAEGCFNGWLLMVIVLLVVFYFLDVTNMRRIPDRVRLQHAEAERWHFSGGWAVAAIGMILGAVFLPTGVREGVMLLAAGLSWWRTPRSLYEGNQFSWGPLREVAWLFAGIFVTMVPALDILRERVGSGGGMPTALGLFWSTGVLSGVLDNAPTYMAFLVSAMAATGLDVETGMATFVVRHPDLLRGISMGAVFFGAATYIGNGPNLMVRAICQQQGIWTPSFGGYVLRYTVPILLPVLGLVGWMVLR